MPAQEASAFDSAVYETTVFGAASQTHLAEIGKQVLDPEHYAHPLSLPANPQAKALPAVPATIVLTLFGFLCVSITRDRRAWLALAGGILWLGQAGIQTVPQLANRICARSIRRSTANKCLSFSHTIAVQPTSRDEQTTYAGLLHKLAAIPHSAASFISNSNAKASTPALATGGAMPGVRNCPGRSVAGYSKPVPGPRNRAPGTFLTSIHI